MNRIVPLLAAALAAGSAAAEPLVVGSPLPALSLEDQHGERRALDASLSLVLFSRDMDAGAAIKEALAEDGQAFLERHRAVYVSDVSGMPRLVLRLMARPAMRNRPYPVLLDEDGAATSDFPSQEGRVTLLFLEGGRVARVAHAADADEVRTLVGEQDEPTEEGAE